MWDELQIEPNNTQLLLECLDDLPEEKASQLLDFEAKQTNLGVSMLQKIGKLVAYREEMVNFMMELSEMYAQTPNLLQNRLEVRKCAGYIAKMRLYSLQVVEGIERWKSFLNALVALQQEKQGKKLVYMWENKDYLEKMQSDLDFLCESPLSRYFSFSPNDPFLLLCSHCGSASMYSPASRLTTHIPSDSGKVLVPVPREYQGRVRMAEVCVLQGRTDRPKTQNDVIPAHPASPRRPNGGRYSLPPKPLSSPKSVPLDLTELSLSLLDDLIDLCISPDLKYHCQEVLSFTKGETRLEVAKSIAEKYMEIAMLDTLRSIAQSVFSEITKAKLLLHSSTILDAIVGSSLQDAIPLIASEAIREELLRSKLAAADFYLQDLLSTHFRSTILDITNEIIAEKLANRFVDALIPKILEESAGNCIKEIEIVMNLVGNEVEMRVLEEILREIAIESEENRRKTEILTKNQTEESIKSEVVQEFLSEIEEEVLDKIQKTEENEGLEDEVDVEVPKIDENQPLNEKSAEFPVINEPKPLEIDSELPEIIANELIFSLISAEMGDYLEEKLKKIAAKMEDAENFLVSMIGKSLVAEVLKEIDYYALAEEVGFGELSYSPLALPTKSSILANWRQERVVREVYGDLVREFCEEEWVFPLCHEQFQLANYTPKLHLSSSKLRLDERMEVIMGTYTSPIPTSGSVSPVLESPDPEEPCFPDQNRLDMMLALDTAVQLTSMEVWEDQLPRVLFSYIDLVGPPMDALVTSPETLLDTLKSSVNPQLFWLTMERYIVGMVCFRDDVNHWDRVTCEHFSVLDFRFWSQSIDTVLNWALERYNQVRVRMYYESSVPSEYMACLIAKELKTKIIQVEKGVNCLQISKKRRKLLKVSRGMRFFHSSIVNSADLELISSEKSELSTELRELQRLKYVKYHENRLELSGKLRFLGSECRLLNLKGRFYRVIRVNSEFVVRMTHLKGYEIALMRTNDPCLSAFLLTSQRKLPKRTEILRILQESTASERGNSEIWFPNFTMLRETMTSRVEMTCAGREAMSTVRVRRGQGVVYSDDFVFGDV